MTRYVAFLKDINLPGKTPVAIDGVKSAFSVQGIENVNIYIQSGIVLFDSDEANETLLRTIFENKLSALLEYPVTVIIRMHYEIKKVIRDMPFHDLKSEDRNKLYVTFLSESPSFDVKGSLGVYSNDAEFARVVNREVYIYSKNYGKTCFSNTFIEKKLGVTGTTCNWLTVSKLADI